MPKQLTERLFEIMLGNNNDSNNKYSYIFKEEVSQKAFLIYVKNWLGKFKLLSVHKNFYNIDKIIEQIIINFIEVDINNNNNNNNLYVFNANKAIFSEILKNLFLIFNENENSNFDFKTHFYLQIANNVKEQILNNENYLKIKNKIILLDLVFNSILELKKCCEIEDFLVFFNILNFIFKNLKNFNYSNLNSDNNNSNNNPLNDNFNSLTSNKYVKYKIDNFRIDLTNQIILTFSNLSLKALNFIEKDFKLGLINKKLDENMSLNFNHIYFFFVQENFLQFFNILFFFDYNNIIYSINSNDNNNNNQFFKDFFDFKYDFSNILPFEIESSDIILSKFSLLNFLLKLFNFVEKNNNNEAFLNYYNQFPYLFNFFKSLLVNLIEALSKAYMISYDLNQVSNLVCLYSKADNTKKEADVQRFTALIFDILIFSVENSKLGLEIFAENYIE